LFCLLLCISETQHAGHAHAIAKDLNLNLNPADGHVVVPDSADLLAATTPAPVAPAALALAAAAAADATAARVVAVPAPAPRYDGLVTISGDGLFHEVMNGLGARPDAITALRFPVGIIPAGSGNGLTASLGWNRDVVKAALHITRGLCRPMDLMVHATPSVFALS
jgi:diacylglycerol kinase family enzyme